MADVSSMLLQGIAAVLTKIASASTVAQVAAGLGVTVAGITGAGAAGVLPGPVQDGVAGAIEAVTPFDVPDSHDDRVPGLDDPAPAAVPPTTPTQTSPSPSPTELPVVPPPAAPSSTHEVEPGDDDGVHQHRGGAVPTGAPAPTPTQVVDDSPEVEDHSGADDDAGSHGDDSSGRHGGSSGHGSDG